MGTWGSPGWLGRGDRGVRRFGVAASALCATALAGAATDASAVTALDGRLEAHGYFEEQIRGISNNFNENLDLTQWYSILDLELEANLLPDGFGPISGLSAFVRLEARYDCVWTRACGLFPSADVFGDRANKLPPRLGNSEVANTAGVIETGPQTLRLGPGRRVGSLATVEGFDTLFGIAGGDGLAGTGDDPALYTFQRYQDYRFAMRKIEGGQNGLGTQTLGPWLPKNKIVSYQALADRANPFRGTGNDPGCTQSLVNPAVGDCNPTIPIFGSGPTNPPTAYGNTGSSSLPYRPAPLLGNLGPSNRLMAQGIYYPSPGFQQWLRNGRHSTFDQNFSQTELAWNHGASQQDERELKEAYLDAELLDGQLWMRIGKQTIVWGKTELFATTDQFNPQDLALASLPSLEESRIALWSVRSVLSLYEIGPLSDVRLEGAVNLDDFEPSDLGRCGEAYTANPVCDKTFGLFAHGATGLGVAGETRPEYPWKSTQGLQGGARLEFRWDRFSFAIVDIYSYETIPYANRIYSYSRNVDPIYGRPREAEATGTCSTGTEPACLTAAEALAKQSVNQQTFAVICSSSVGFSQLDPTACAQSVFNSQNTVSGFPIATLLSALLSGNSFLNSAIVGQLSPFALPIVALSRDPGDGPIGSGALSSLLTNQQEALLGCGPFYGTNCDQRGIDLLNAEASALVQSWPGDPGTRAGWDTANGAVLQPGTVGYYGGPACTRRVGRQILVLPGCRGPTYNSATYGGPNDYSPIIDGTTATIGYDPTFPGNPDNYNTTGHPLAAQQGALPGAGQPWASELAALSWNFLMVLVSQSPNWDGQPPATASLTSCSVRAPQFCSTVKDFYSVTGVQRRNQRAAGNGNFGRRDFLWSAGGEVVLQYEKRNVLGFSTDFAEDFTKSNWGVEAAWIQGSPFADSNEADGITKADTYNLTVSIDRPTFINFLNPNHTFFFNTQIFFQYIAGFERGFQTTGPWNFLGTFTIQTGYFQDRLLPSVTFVYDVESNSGAALPQVQYRFTESFSVTFGMNFFFGRFVGKDMPLNPLSLGEQNGKGAYHVFTEPGVSVVHDRDEAYVSIRYTF